MLPNSLSWSRELGHPANPVRQPSDNGPPMGHQWATNGLYVAATSCVVFIAVFIIVPLGTATPTPAARSEPTQHQQTKTFSVRSTQYAVHIYPGNRRRAPTKKGNFALVAACPSLNQKKRTIIGGPPRGSLQQERAKGGIIYLYIILFMMAMTEV